MNNFSDRISKCFSNNFSWEDYQNCLRFVNSEIFEYLDPVEYGTGKYKYKEGQSKNLIINTLFDKAKSSGRNYSKNMIKNHVETQLRILGVI